MTTTSSVFDQLAETFRNEGTGAALKQLCDELTRGEKYHELFEARKLLLRHQLGLTLMYSGSGDDLDESTQTKLEDGLAGICRDIGKKLMEAGKLREGWMYLRPIGELELAKQFILETEPDDESLDELIELALREGIAPVFGFSLVLQHYGTCNSITTFDAEMSQHSPEDRQAAAGMLVEHLHAELLENVKNDIENSEGKTPEGDRFADLLPDRPWLFEGNRYHTDTTHLASVIRFSRQLTNEDQIRLAIDLTEYGRRLSTQYQYENEEPFANLYVDTGLYLRAMIGEAVDDAVTFFRQKADACDAYNEGYMAIEVFIELLYRVGRYEEAIEALIERMPDATPRIGIAPSLYDISHKMKNFERFTEFCRQQNDLLGFTTGLLNKTEAES